jgi:hypothetical protein
MSAAPQEAVAEAEPAPPSSQEPTAVEAGSPDGAAPVSPAENPKPVPATVEVWGKQILVSDLIEHFDPSCRDRCEEGRVKVLRPMPKPFKGTVVVRELCVCTVRRYAEAHPPEDVLGGLSPAARAEARGARPGAGGAARDKLTRLRTEISRETTKLMTLRAQIVDRVAPLEAALEEIGHADGAARADVDSRASRSAAAQHRKDECVRALHAIEAILVGIEDEATRAAADAEDRARRRRTTEADLERLRATISPAEGPLVKSIEKLERRIATVLAYHPELEPSPAAA